MSDAGEPAPEIRADSWRALLGHGHRGVVIVFAGGIGVFAMNTYLTAASLPSAIAEIGGQSLYAWVSTVYLLASVVASMTVTRVLQQAGPRGAYLWAFGLFGLGSAVCALSPTMPIMLCGRTIQGLGGGLLTGLAFAVVRVALPEVLWLRAVGLFSAMWGVGNLVGPVTGGFFAQIGLWRGSFWLLVLVTVAVAVPVTRAIPERPPSTPAAQPLPLTSLLLVAAATAAVSVAAVVHTRSATTLLVVIGVLLFGEFLVADRRRRIGLLPRLAFRIVNPLKWIYLSIAILAIGSTSELFIPLFGQRIGGMSPFVAGLLGAALSWGWTVAQLVSSTWATGRRANAVRVVGPLALAAGLTGYGLMQAYTSPVAMIGWFVTLGLAGTGIGMAFPHVAAAAMTITDDEAEAARASAGVNTVQMIANTFGTAAAGLLVSLGDSEVSSARFLMFGFALLALVGTVVGLRSLGRM
ncbi:MFS transporter [Gordonia rhizosphera]|uniref:Putative drug resistance transporter n=1 Tax=Gordonia rhizosphera NBRC 16068 TaxID=1108045 RepID=K6W6Y8_9ACTN|nr:MFS transporter [Gordonia rhizosphera]GAB89491.1 putative drug resistance transporter [Gordonia rhizosphera NBRC 16068]